MPIIFGSQLTSSHLSTLALATGQALGLWLLHQAIAQQIWPATDLGVLIGLYLNVIFLPLTLLVLWRYRSRRNLWLALVSISFFLIFSATQAFPDISIETFAGSTDEDQVIEFFLPWSIAWLIALPMLRTALETNQWRLPYATLFRNSWRSYLIIAESVLFTGLVWLLLLLCAALFQILGNDFFKSLFQNPKFIYPVSTFAFATATQLIGSSDRFIDSAIEQILDLMKWLLPLAGFIVVSFSITLIPKLPSLFADHEKVVDSAILLALIAATLLLFNAAYRDGTVEPAYGRWLREALRFVPAFLVVIALTALYSVSVRWIDGGLTPSRYWAMVAASFAVLYAAGYCYASARSGFWLSAIKQVNLGVSTILLITLLASLTPVADPLRLSVRSQVDRALRAPTTSIQISALSFLRFDAGARGRSELNQIIEGSVPKDRAQRTANLREEARRIANIKQKAALSSMDPALAAARYTQWRSTLRVIPTESIIAPSLEEVLRSDLMISSSILNFDGESSNASLVFVDLNGDEIDEALLIAGTARGESGQLRDYRVFRMTDGRWIKSASGALR